MSEIIRSPYEQAVAMWAGQTRDHPLAWYEDAHKRNGFVYATPAFYVMGRPIVKAAPLADILNVEHVFDFEQCDTWFIFMLTGEVRQAWAILPWSLPWMCWQRDNDPTDELRFFEAARLARLSAPD